MSCRRCQDTYGNSPDGQFASSRPSELCLLVYHRCAFDDEGKFKRANANCGTIGALRTMCDDTYYQTPPGKWTWSTDSQQSLFTLEFGQKFVVIGAYKNRSRTEIALVIEEEESRSLTLVEAEEAIDYWKKKPNWLKLND